jgi:predicted lipoprotein with Yx(FWY)xxD motif
MNRIRSGVPAFLALCLIGPLCLCACSSSPTARPSGAGKATAAADELKVGYVTGLGPVVVDGAGRTVYRYIPDHRRSSTCTGACAVDWPPLLAVPHPRYGPGILRSLVGWTARPNGRRQVTYDGWPVYTSRLDTAPGQAAGQAYDMGLWYALVPTSSVAG